MEGILIYTDAALRALMTWYDLHAEAVAFLARCERAGIRLESCSTYVREWISREEDEPAKPPRKKRR